MKHKAARGFTRKTVQEMQKDNELFDYMLSVTEIREGTIVYMIRIIQTCYNFLWNPSGEDSRKIRSMIENLLTVIRATKTGHK